MSYTETAADSHLSKTLLPSLLILPVTFAAFYLLPQFLGKTAGYLSSFALYWIFCLIHGSMLKQGSMAKLYALPKFTRQNLFWSLLCFIPMFGAFMASFTLAFSYLTPILYIILAIGALINGFVEEFYWRGAFISRYKQNIQLAYLLPTVLFGLWHISVYMAYGVQYQGGFWPLVGGALFMGALWGYTAYKQQRVLVVTLAHILTNFFAFSNLVVENWLK